MSNTFQPHLPNSLMSPLWLQSHLLETRQSEKPVNHPFVMKSRRLDLFKLVMGQTEADKDKHHSHHWILKNVSLMRLTQTQRGVCSRPLRLLWLCLCPVFTVTFQCCRRWLFSFFSLGLTIFCLLLYVTLFFLPPPRISWLHQRLFVFSRITQRLPTDFHKTSGNNGTRAKTEHNKSCEVPRIHFLWIRMPSS